MSDYHLAIHPHVGGGGIKSYFIDKSNLAHNLDLLYLLVFLYVYLRIVINL